MGDQTTKIQSKNRESQRRPCRSRRSAFLLILVTVVLAMASLAALNFARSMLIAHSSSRFSNARLQARMCAESGAQAVRLFLSYPKTSRIEMGGTWNNPSMFQALNIIPDSDPARRGNVTIISPSVDEFGNYSSLRYGLQNESAKVNLLTLVQLDALASSGNMAASALGGGAGTSELASDLSAGLGSTLAADILMSLPGMTESLADAILDFLDEDNEPRMYGAEFDDYYRDLPTPYKPPNGPIHSIEQLLLVRGVTPALLFGYDENRNGILDQGEMTKMSMGVQPGTMPGTISAASLDPDATPPPPLGWAPYLTIHSAEKNLSSDGYEKININSDDLETLYADLTDVLGNEEWASFIVAYRIGGQPGGGGINPLAKLAEMAAAEADDGGAMSTQLGLLSAITPAGNTPDNSNAEPWTVDALDEFDLSQGGSVKFNQILDLFDATVTAGGNNQQGGGRGGGQGGAQGGGRGGGQGGGQAATPGAMTTYASPFSSVPIDMANSTPLLMDYLTTIDAPSMPGRINIMECPLEILRGIPGLSDEIVEQILQARVDGSDSATRNFETWLAVEGFLTLDEMRAILPLVTCGGDVFKAQVIGYMEGDAAFSRIEVIVNAAGDLPEIQFFRRLDHLGRGFDIMTLGQRFDAAMPGQGSQMGGIQ